MPHIEGRFSLKNNNQRKNGWEWYWMMKDAYSDLRERTKKNKVTISDIRRTNLPREVKNQKQMTSVCR